MSNLIDLKTQKRAKAKLFTDANLRLTQNELSAALHTIRIQVIDMECMLDAVKDERLERYRKSIDGDAS